MSILNDSVISDPTRNPVDSTAVLVWLIFCLIFGLLGNAYVLVATFKYNAIRIDAMSLWFIKGLAVADLTSLILMVLPVTLTNITKNIWPLGDFLCIVVAFTSRIPFLANIILIVGMNVNKVYRLSYPLRSLHVAPASKVFWTTGTLLLAIINPLLDLVFNFKGTHMQVQYNAIASVCRLVGESRTVVVVRLALYIVLPSLILTITNGTLLGIACRKTLVKVKKRNIVIVVGVTMQFLAAFIPYSVVLSVRFYLPVPDWMIRGAFLLLYISCSFSPIVYYFNNRGFKRFTNSFIR